jgi:flagellar basal-body rod protein FlgF
VHSGIYTAYSGLKAQMEALDVLASNLANVNTTGFKEQKAFFSALNQALDSSDAAPLDSVINTHAVLAESALNIRDGALVETHRDLDLALIGNGFLAVDTPGGVRYTRNGNLTTNAKSVLCTAEGLPVLGERGQIVLGTGKVDINEQGEVLLGGIRVDRLKLVTFDSPATLRREGGSLLAPFQEGATPKPAAGVTVRQGYQEQSNVNPVLATVRMLEIMRHFEAIQKSVNLMYNEMDAKSIDRLGR